VQITPNDANTNSGQSTSLDLKIAQLVSNFASKPLLIEKFLLTQSQGILLNLSNGKQPLELQLPLNQAKLFDYIGQNITKLVLSITPQKNIQLTLITPELKTTIITENQPLAKLIVFQKAVLSPDGLLKLDNPKAQTTTTTNYVGQSNLTRANASKLTTNEITIAQAAKTLLKTHFSKQLSVASHLNKITDIANNTAKIDSPQPLVAKLSKQLAQFFSSIEKSSHFSAAEIKQRINNSGHFLEKNLSQLIQFDAESKNVKISTGKPLELTKQLMNKTSLPITKNISLEQNNDSKLMLLKIKTTLETLIRKIETSPKQQKNQSQPIDQKILLEQLIRIFSPKQNPGVAPTTIQKTNQTKNQLLNLQQTVLKQTTEMLTEIKNTISQIESNQLLSLKNETPNLHQFLIDLPIKNNSDIDSFEMLFENSDITNNNKKVKRWKVIVKFDLEPLGPMFAQIELENERISTHFFAKARETAQLINQHLHVLKKSLFSAGVDIDKLQGSQGKIPDTLLQNSEQLVDTHV